MANNKASVKQVDFTNVKEGGVFNTKRIEAGDYLAKIIKVEDAPVKTGDNKGNDQYLFTIRLEDKPSSVFPYYCQLTENQLWKLRNLLIAAGKAVPKRKTKVDPNQIVGKLIGVLIEDDVYTPKDGGAEQERSTIDGVFPAADIGDITSPDDAEEEEEIEEDEPLEEDEETEEEEDDEVEDDEEEEDPLASLNRNQLKAQIIKIQSDFQARKSQSDDDLREILRLLNEEADEEDDEPAPAPKRATKAKAKPAPAKKAPAASTTKKKAKPKVEEIDDDELDELDIDNL